MRYATAGELAADLREFLGIKKRGLLRRIAGPSKPPAQPSTEKEKRQEFWKRDEVMRCVILKASIVGRHWGHGRDRYVFLFHLIACFAWPEDHILVWAIQDFHRGEHPKPSLRRLHVDIRHAWDDERPAIDPSPSFVMQRLCGGGEPTHAFAAYKNLDIEPPSILRPMLLLTAKRHAAPRGP